MIRPSGKDDGVRKELTERITKLTLNSKYNLTSLQYTPQHFGNVVVEIANDHFVVRFIYDRGDIYRDKRTIDSTHWIDDELVYNHSMPKKDVYELLLKAIEDFVMKS